MKVDLAKHAARIPTQTGEGLAYIDYLEVAPWNIREISLGARAGTALRRSGCQSVRGGGAAQQRSWIRRTRRLALSPSSKDRTVLPKNVQDDAASKG